MIVFDRVIIKDFKVLERAEISLADRGLVLIQGNNQDTLSAISNGAGKTTIFEAVSWVLFGQYVGTPRPGSDVIRCGAGKAVVEIEFRDLTESYRVVRTHNGKTAGLQLFVNGEAVVHREKSQTQDAINSIVGLDWDSFRNTVLYGQSDTRRFSDPESTDAERKAILKRILGLERFDIALERAKEEGRKIKTELDALSLDIAKGVGRIQVTEKQLNSVNARVEGFKVQREEKIADLKESLAKWQRPEPVEEGRIEKLRSFLPAAIKNIAQLDRAKDSLTEIKLKISDRDTLRTLADSDINRLETERHRLKYQVLKFQSAICPTCGADTSHSSLASSTYAVQQARLSEIDIEIEQLQEKVMNLDAQVYELGLEKRTLSSQVESLIPWRTKKFELEQAIKDLEQQQRDYERFDASINGLEQELDAYEKMENPHLDSQREARMEFDAAIEAQMTLGVKVEQADKKLEPIKFWIEAFSGKGIPSFAMDSVVPMISEAANRYLMILSDGDLGVEIKMQSELKSGEQKEAISLNFIVEGVEGVRPSGGQRKKFAIAIDLALMEIVTKREGANIDLLMLDEIFEGLDAEGSSRIVALLEHLRESKGTILVIAHDPRVAETFENVIVVNKSNRSSVVDSDG